MGRLEAVAAWFNPSDSLERVQARRKFEYAWSQHGDAVGLHVPTMTIFPTSTNAFIWQKERLLNLAIRQLPSDVDKVIWVDTDILIDSPTWAADVSAALDRWPVVQPWSDAFFLDAIGQSAPGPFGRGYVESVPRCVQKTGMACGLHAESWPGFCWAARREVLEAIGGLYEHDLSGPNDVLMSLAFYGDFQHSFLLRYGSVFRDHYMRWAEKAYSVVQGNVGFVPATLTHLWHGPFEQRKYLERTVRLMEAGYDPARHVTTAPDGTLMLTEDCPWEVRRLAAAVVGVRLHPDKGLQEMWERVDQSNAEWNAKLGIGRQDKPISETWDDLPQPLPDAKSTLANLDAQAAAERFIYQQTQAALSDGCCDKPVSITVG